jgi:hypothetical protein
VPRRPITAAPLDLLEHEFAREKATALGRLGHALERALATLHEHDLRAALVRRAGVALWHLIVQREACGLRNMQHVLRDYRVPREVVARMGAWQQ